MVFNATFNKYFSYIVAVSFIGGGNRSIRTKPLSCHKLELNTYTESVRSLGFCTNQLIEGNCTPLFHILIIYLVIRDKTTYRQQRLISNKDWPLMVCCKANFSYDNINFRPLPHPTATILFKAHLFPTLLFISGDSFSKVHGQK